jgi:hypothetical protein
VSTGVKIEAQARFNEQLEKQFASDAWVKERDRIMSLDEYDPPSDIGLVWSEEQGAWIEEPRWSDPALVAMGLERQQSIPGAIVAVKQSALRSSLKQFRDGLERLMSST